MPDASDPAIEEALEFLRGHLCGIFRFDGDVRDVKIVVLPDGRLAAPAMVAMLRAVDTVLCLPDEADTSLHLQVTLEPFEDRGETAEFADRWRIYHGDPPDVRWAIYSVDAARYNGLFMDGIALTRPNPLASVESSICKAINTFHVDALRKAVLRCAEVEMERPVAVGIDPLGLDVRGQFEVVRLPLTQQIERAEDSLSALVALADARGQAPPPRA